MPDLSEVPHSGSALESRQRPEPITVEFEPFSRGALCMPPQVWLSLVMIKAYQVLVPSSIKRQCIYEPTCSRYAMMVIQRDGLLLGVQSARARWLRCDASRFMPGLDLP
jgi:putative membrane protein insertion efficiency factor